MASGNRDANRHVVLMGVSSADLSTPIPLTVDPDTGKLRAVWVSFTGNPSPAQPAKRDANRVPVLMGESNDSNRTPIPFSVNLDSNGWLVDES